MALLDDGTTLEGDLLVGADGVGSAVRTGLLGPQARHDTGWSCATWWIDSADHPAALGETVEFWGAGTFIGAYPLPRTRLPHRRRSLVGRARPPRPGAGCVVPSAEPDCPPTACCPPPSAELTLWPMTDVRSDRWIGDRVALLGDAATAFLPTAGMGASMALESAAALADELSRCDAAQVPNALRLYERWRRSRVERAQRQSRMLARALFTSSHLCARLRNGLVARAPAGLLLGPLLRDLEEPV
ncbi:FAD-dependent monooxygenase [Nocardioides sp. TF02-7]|nr:NAD(P)/FAD-dependent oxidoreductase [Nocardioides sp. TF02-7]UMG94751.1 FAD-dependent monooxygenase [Nocardioides sp. TF02-7]